MLDFYLWDQLPREQEAFVLNGKEYLVVGVVYYYETVPLNRPHIRIYLR
jgi:hypothetical protein